MITGPAEYTPRIEIGKTELRQDFKIHELIVVMIPYQKNYIPYQKNKTLLNLQEEYTFE